MLTNVYYLQQVLTSLISDEALRRHIGFVVNVGGNVNNPVNSGDVMIDFLGESGTSLLVPVSADSVVQYK